MKELQMSSVGAPVVDTTAMGRAISATTAVREPPLKEIPYDHVATFKLTGDPGNRVPATINVSVDGAFVATAIGYSFIPADFTVALNPQGDITQPVDATVSIVSAFAEPMLAGDTRGIFEALLNCLMVKLCGIDFKYSIVDSSVGRELQNLPIHNIAGLGRADGDRPFRPMAKPMLFMPRSTIRIEVEEISSLPIHKGAELFIVLHGYKILGHGTT